MANKSSQTIKRSEVDPSRIITEECWAISLVRLSDTTSGGHVFLVLEGKDDKSKIWFADFVANNLTDTIRSGKKELGKVRIESHESAESGELLYRCTKTMMKIEKNSRLLYSTWSIPKSKADLLIANLKKQQENSLQFSILGKNGYNCFTFAKMNLHDLNDDYIQIPEDTVGKWIVSAAATRAPSSNERWNILWLRAFAVGRGIGFAILKLLHFFYKEK